MTMNTLIRRATLLLCCMGAALSLAAQQIPITDAPGRVIVIEGVLPHDGLSVAGLGDVNGDGYADLAVGAPYAASDVIERATSGLAYLVYGGPDLPDTVYLAQLGDLGVTLVGEESLNEENEFGKFVHAAGDVNNDGYADMISLAPSYFGFTDDDGITLGRGYLLFGSDSLPELIDIAALGGLGVVFSSATGVTSLNRAGDVNGDGMDDLVVGEFDHDVGGGETPIASGRAVILPGRESWPGMFDLSLLPGGALELHGKRDYEQTGLVVEPLGDVDGDGFDDVGVTQDETFDDDGTPIGRAFIVYGRSELSGVLVAEDASGDVTVLTSQSSPLYPGNRIGAIHGGQDLNGDGRGEVITGLAEAGRDTQSGIGLAVVLEGSADRPETVALDEPGAGRYLLWGDSSRGRLGTAVRALSDVSGGGVPDLAISSPASEGIASVTQEGRLYLVSGERLAAATASVGTAALALEGVRAFEGFGLDVDSAGDVNGDGRMDLIVSSSPLSTTEPGRAYVILMDEDPADLNGDLLRDERDLFQLADDWWTSPVPGTLPARADRNGDGRFDAADILPFIADF